MDLFEAMLRLGGPLVLAAMAGLLSERSGIINIALEGKMLAAAAAGAMVSASTHNPYLGLLAGLIAAVALSLLHGMATIGFRVDHVVSGMAINALSLGVTGFAAKLAANNNIEQRFDSLPQIFYIFLAFISTQLVLIWLLKTKPGLRLNAVGNDPTKASEMGVSVVYVRIWALIWCGVLAGLAGVMLVSQPEQFSSGMTAGKGFIALAALILGGWKVIPTMIAAFGFGLFDALQLRLQGQEVFGIIVPTQLWASLPYILTLVALAGFLGRSRPPAALGR